MEKINRIFFAFFTSIGGNLVVVVMTLFMTNLMNPDEFGRLRYLLNVATIFLTFMSMGRENVLVVESIVGEKRKLISEEVLISFLLMIFLSIALYLVLSSPFKELMPKSITSIELILSLMMIPLWGGFNLLMASFRSLEFVNQAFWLSNLFQRIVRLVTVLIFLQFSLSCLNLLYAYIYSQIVLVLASLVFLYRVGFRFDLSNLRLGHYIRRAKNGTVYMLLAISFVLLVRIDAFMIGIFGSLQDIGVYDVAFSIAIFSLFPYLALMKTSETVAISISQDPKIFLKYKEDLSLAKFFSLFISLGCVFYGDYFLGWFGDTYKDGYEVLVLLAGGFTSVIFLGVPVEILAWGEKRKVALLITFIGLLLNISLNMLLIPIVGTIGAAVASVVSLFVSRFIAITMVKLIFDLDAKLEIKYFLCSFGLLVSGYLIRIDGEISIKYFFVNTVLFLITSCIALWLWRRNEFVLNCLLRFTGILSMKKP